MLNLVRSGLGHLISFFDRMTRGEPIERSPEEQKRVDEQLEKMALYQFHGCPFCVKVRRAAHRLNLDLEYRDARNNEAYRKELNQEGGKVQVPCLRIDRDGETEWMYESDDIIDFLERKFG